MAYEELIERNLGVFTESEQEKIRNARVVIVGCGGIGGVVAIALARSGVENFVLVEFDVFAPSNMNRQITCFSDTLGINKALIAKDTILQINPDAKVTVHENALTPEKIDDTIRLGDVIMPAADDWAISITMLGRCKELGKPAIMAYPVGALGRVSTFMPQSPYAAECLAMPYKSTVEDLREFQNDPNNRKILYYYQSQGGWRQEWFDDWCEGKRPHAQLCTIVWTTGALAAMEIIKLVSGKWKPVVAPRYWMITPEGAKMRKFRAGRRLMSRLSSRKWGRKLIPAIAGQPWLVKAFTKVIS
jgi:sulfur-carrier protein adenylyltransferase/sulfurtransferase